MFLEKAQQDWKFIFSGHPFSLPIADSFLVLIDAVLEIKDAFLGVCAQISPENPIEPITESQW